MIDPGLPKGVVDVYDWVEVINLQPFDLESTGHLHIQVVTWVTAGGTSPAVSALVGSHHQTQG